MQNLKVKMKVKLKVKAKVKLEINVTQPDSDTHGVRSDSECDSSLSIN